MSALVRRNLTFLISKHISSSVCKSHVSFSLPLRFSSTSSSSGRETVTSPTSVDDMLLHKHNFSPEVVSGVSSMLPRLKNPEKADSVLSFLRESGFSNSQLERIVKDRPQLLFASLEVTIKSKIKIFHEFGFSSDDITKLITSNPSILHSSADCNIIPSLSVLKGMLGSSFSVVRVLRKSPWLITQNLEKTMVPNVEFFKSIGIPMDHILAVLYNSPRFISVKPESIKKSVETADEIGFDRSSRLFVYAVRVIASLSNETWEMKLQAFQDLGFSESDILMMFRKSPMVLSVSMEKIKKVKEVLLATGKFNLSCIVNNPVSLSCSIEKKYKPQLRILGILESRNLIKNWPSLGTLCRTSDDKFFKTFISPYFNDVGGVDIKEFMEKED